MAIPLKKTLNDVSPSSERLQAAYDAAMRFMPSTLTPVTPPTDLVQRLAAQEAGVDLLEATAGVTSGMQSVLRQAALAPLAPWANLHGDFESAVQPFIEKINAVRNFEANKAAIEKLTKDRVEAVLKGAEAERRYSDRKAAKEKADLHFEGRLKGVGGRPVNFFGRTWLYVLILAAITSIEWLINFDSFFNWTGVLAIAAGFTLGMALAVALAAHVHGEYLKQRNSRFGLAADTQGRDIAFLLLATAGLLVAVTVAGWARYSLAMHNIGAQGPTIKIEGIGPEQVSPVTDVYFSLGINMIVWLVGLVISFMSHDEDHHLMSAWFERWLTTRRFNRVHRRWEKRIKTIEAQGALELDRLIEGTRHDESAVKRERDMYEQISTRDDRIFQALANQLQGTVDLYRLTLGNLLNQNDHRIVIDGQESTGHQYQNMSVSFDAAALRCILS